MIGSEKCPSTGPCISAAGIGDTSQRWCTLCTVLLAAICRGKCAVYTLTVNNADFPAQEAQKAYSHILFNAQATSCNCISICSAHGYQSDHHINTALHNLQQTLAKRSISHISWVLQRHSLCTGCPEDCPNSPQAACSLPCEARMTTLQPNAPDVRSARASCACL